MKTKFKNILAVALCLFSMPVLATETFWLMQIATQGNVKEMGRPELPYPGSYLTTETITIDGNKIFLDDKECYMEIDEVVPFQIDRTLARTIDFFGGDEKFAEFLHTQLHTDIKEWKTEYMTKRADKTWCRPLQYGRIYRSKNEIILDAGYYYRFILRDEKKVGDINKLTGFLDGDCVALTSSYIKGKIDYCRYPDEMDTKIFHCGFKYECYLKDGDSRLVYGTLNECKNFQVLDLTGGP